MKSKLKVVFDTNIYLSAIVFGGNPRQCLELARKKEFILFSSRAILLELAKTLQNKFFWSQEETREVIRGLAVFTKVILPKTKINFIKKDPKDNRILECALTAEADYLVSGDKKHLLSLKKFKKTSVISAKQFLDIFYRKN